MDGIGGSRAGNGCFFAKACRRFRGLVVMLYLTNGPEKASWLKADERVWLIDRLRRERPVREAHGKHTLWEALAHPRDQASTKGPPSAGGDQRGARPATTACGAPSNGLSSQLHW
jgi:hypothetical protein